MFSGKNWLIFRFILYFYIVKFCYFHDRDQLAIAWSQVVRFVILSITLN